MTIGIISPISTADFAPYLYKNDATIAKDLSSAFAPAVTTIAIEYLKLGNKIVIYTLDPKATTYYNLKGDRIDIHVAPGRAKNKLGRIIAPLGRDIIVLRKMFRQNNHTFDVISAQWSRDYAIASLFFKKKYPIYVSVRDIMPYIIKQIPKTCRNYPWIVAYVFNEYVMRNKAFKFVANSIYTANSIQIYWGLKVPVIFNPIMDIVKSNPDKSNIKHKEFSIISISISEVHDKRKNIISLLKAFKIVRKIHPEVKLILIGRHFSQQNSEIMQLEKDGLVEGVSLLGEVAHDKVIDILRDCNLMVHPSLEETFGNTLIEAMAVNCPVLGGYDSGAVPYVLDQGNAGYLCNVKDENDIASKIIYIIDHPDEAKKKALYAQQFCRNNYSSEIVAKKYINLFENGCNNTTIS